MVCQVISLSQTLPHNLIVIPCFSSRRSVCRFEGVLPDVCCPENKIIIGQDIETTTTTTESGSWQSWSEWDDCSAECGGGKQSRRRECSTAGLCVGESVEERDCNTESCSKISWAVRCCNNSIVRY